MLKPSWGKIFITAVVFFFGYRIGVHHRPKGPCHPSAVAGHYAAEMLANCECPIAGIAEDHTYIHTNDIKDSALTRVFHMLHHASDPSDGEVILTQSAEWKSDFSTCETVYAVRSPTRVDHPNKCVAIVRAAHTSQGPHYSPGALSHRNGSIDWPQVLTNQYQDDVVHAYSRETERNTTVTMLDDREDLLRDFKHVVGEPLRPDGSRRSVVMMVRLECIITRNYLHTECPCVCTY